MTQTLNLSPKDSSPLDGIKSQPPITDVMSSEAFKQARIWLDDCDKHHVHCSQPETPHLPNRVLDISLDNAPGFVRLIESKGSKGDYVALLIVGEGNRRKFSPAEDSMIFSTE